MITLVPAHLFELRYFSPAVVIAVVSSSTPSQCDVEEEEITPKREGPEYHGGEHDPHTKDTVQSDSLLSPCHLHLYFNVCVSCLVNVVTISLFLHKPFIWNDGTTARFMY